MTFDERETGRKLQQSNLESFLKTFKSVLNIDGKEPDEKERLNKSASCLEIFFFRRIRILFGILNEPLVLLMLREDIMLAISSLPEGWRNIEILH